MWFSARLEDTPDPGDKGIGLLALEGSGLPIPPTLVYSKTTDHFVENACVAVTADTFKYLQIPSGGRTIIRPSVKVARADSAAISGLYDSSTAERANFEMVISDVADRYHGKDRISELQMLGEGDRASSGMFLLVQPMIEPDFSGVAHLTLTDGRPEIRLGLLTGHLERLVQGHDSGLQCQVTRIELARGPDIAVIADEEDVMAILDLPMAARILDILHDDLIRFQLSGHLHYEIEWLAVSSRVIYVQAQPLTGVPS